MPSVAINTDGSFVIAWSDFRTNSAIEIFAQQFSENGDPVGSNFKVNYLSAYMNYRPVVAYKPNGDFIITWGDGDEDSMMDNISQKRENNSILSRLMGAPDIWAQQFMNDGTPIGENFKVNDDEGFTFQMNPDLAVDPEGNFIITWEDNRDGSWEIYLQRYLSDGTPIEDNYQADDFTNSDWALDPSISMDGDGNFNLAWRDNRNDIFDVFCKQFSGNGTALGNSFQVNNDFESDYRYSPEVSTNTNGSFIILWTDRFEGNYNIYAQQYLSEGIPFGENYGVTMANELEQSASSVVLSNSRIFSSWQDNSSGQTGFDIWANVIDWNNIIGIQQNELSELQDQSELLQNYPNPFSNETTITYSIKHDDFVTLNIFNGFGTKIKSLVNKTQPANTYSVRFDGSQFNSGVYYYKLTVGGSHGKIKKMILLK